MTTPYPLAAMTTTSYPANTANMSNNSIPPGDYSCHKFVNLNPEKHMHLLASYKLLIFVSLFFIVAGLIGNTLSLLVFTRKDMRGTSSNIYLLVLAVSDSLYLVSAFLAKILKDLKCLYFPESNASLIDTHDSLCKLFQYLQDLFSDYSTCLILAFTIERYIAVYLPMKYKDLCTVNRARLACIVILLGIAIFIAPYHFIMMGRISEYNICTVLQDYNDQFSTLYVVEALLFRIIPVFFITVLNIFIIIKVTRMANEARMRKGREAGGCNAHKRTRKDDKNLQLTIMLILVSTSYVLLYLPVLIHFILVKLDITEVIHLSEDGLDIAQNYTSALYVSGFGINFFLYTVSGRVFRDQLKALLCGYKTKEQKNGYMKQQTEQTQI